MSINRTWAISKRWVAFDSSGLTFKLRLRLGVAQTIPHFGHGFVSFSKCQRVFRYDPNHDMHCWVAINHRSYSRTKSREAEIGNTSGRASTSLRAKDRRDAENRSQAMSAELPCEIKPPMHANRHELLLQREPVRRAARKDL